MKYLTKPISNKMSEKGQPINYEWIVYFDQLSQAINELIDKTDILNEKYSLLNEELKNG